MKFLRMLAIGFVVLLVAGFVLAFSVYDSYSQLAVHHRAARASFADWEAALAPRRTLMIELAEMTEVYSPEAGQIVKVAEVLRAETPDGDNVETRAHMHELVGSKLAQLRGLALRFPQLRDGDDYREWEADYLKHEIAEEAARTSYNSAARQYNSVLDSFSGSLITLIFSVQPKPVLSTPAE